MTLHQVPLPTEESSRLVFQILTPDIRAHYFTDLGMVEVFDTPGPEKNVVPNEVVEVFLHYRAPTVYTDDASAFVCWIILWEFGRVFGFVAAVAESLALVVGLG